MKEAVKTSKYPIPMAAEMRHEFRGSDRYSVLDMNHALHQFVMTEESMKLFVSYTPWGLYCFNTLVMGTAPASSECHERIRIILEGLEGVIQIKDDLVVHGKGQEHDDRLKTEEGASETDGVRPDLQEEKVPVWGGGGSSGSGWCSASKA